MHNHLLIKADGTGVEIFDLSLTPENAKKKGYKYIEDVIYNVIAPTSHKNDILQLIYKNGYKLGSPIHANKPVYGLYAPIK